MISTALKDYRIPRRSRHCLRCTSSFVQGMEYFSLLKENAREDFCVSCWQAGEGIYWKSKVPIQDNDKRSGHEKALDLLREEPETEMGGVVALYLMRNKVITYRGELHELSLYEVLETEEIIAVKKVSLADLDMEKIQEEIAKKLEWKSS